PSYSNSLSTPRRQLITTKCTEPHASVIYSSIREDLPLICNRHCTVALGPYFRRHLCALVLAEPAPGRRRAMREVSVVSRFRSALHERLNVVAKEPLPKR